MTLFDKMRRYAASRPLRLHTPGHKGTLDPLDLTELDFGEDFPGECVAEAESKAAAFYGAPHCRFLVGGSSAGIKAAVMAVGVPILAAKNSHRAVFEAARLARVPCYLVENRVSRNLQMPLTTEDVEAAFAAHSDAGAVVVTSPDYYGQTADLASLAALTRRLRKKLIVDSAHGAHFAARPDLFPPSATLYADACNLSAHKTLPAYTQSAYLVLRDEELVTAADEALALLGTTSPSYLLLAGLEYAVDYAREHARRYDGLCAAADALKSRLVCLDNDDFSRIVIDAGAYGLTGKTLYARLKARNIYAEMYDERYLVCIVSVTDTPEDVFKLADAAAEAVRVK